MTAEDSTPEKGQERIGEQSREWPPLEDATSEKVAHELAAKKQEVRSVVNTLDRALQNEDVLLQDEEVEKLRELGNELRGLASTLGRRVPPEGRREGDE